MFFLVVCSNLLYWYTFGFPAVVVLPLLWVGSIAAEMFLQICFPEKKHKRRMLTYTALVMCLICEAVLWIVQSEAAVGFYISDHLSAVVLLGSVIGKIGYAVMERVQERKRAKEEKEE